LHAPEVIVRNEKRMLQEAVDALFDNGRRGRVLRGANNRPLKSLSDTLKGKQGRFRQNLLGKRVDYSGRSVIVVGPELKLHQCGLPKKMALELFKPFIYHRLEQTGHCTTIKQAKEMVESQEAIVWDILEEVIKDHPVLLNRAPTLHRLGIQAFEPVLVEGKAIKIHPLVCTAFNADFDGDQMAVHIPLSPEAQVEASVLMLASQNILSPASGQPITVPTQDMVLGIYYLTKSRPGAKGEGRAFANIDEVLLALEMGEVETLTPIRLRFTGDVIDLLSAYDDQDVLHTEPVHLDRQYVNTTVGRAILNDHLPEGMPFINGLLKKKGIGQLVNYCYLRFGLETTVPMLDEIKQLGFLYATKAGLSIGIDDMVIPANKKVLVRDAEKQVVNVQQQYLDGAITNGERYNKVIEIWSAITERVADEMFSDMEKQDKSGNINPIFVMADSGARGSKQQIRQLSGMRGLMAKPSGEIIETPITANFREGLTVLQYFISTHGARKGLADTALKTADSGYLTRRLVDVAQDVIISEYDCGTVDGIYVGSIVESGEIIEPLRDRIIGRVSLEKIKDYEGNVIVDINQDITEDLAGAIQSAGIERVKIRSVLTCESKRGVCVMCYGRNLASGRLVELGEAVGVIAAQSIGEPGTQLTMRTFHIGGTASRVSEQSRLEAKNNGVVRFINLQTVKSKTGDLVVMNRNGSIAVVDDKNREKERYAVVYGARVKVEDNSPVALGQVLVEWDPYTFAIVTEIGGTVQFKDLQEGLTLHEEVDEVTGLSRLVVTDSPDEKRQPAIAIKSSTGKGTKRYLMPSRAHLMVQDGDT
ncbi:MAG: DNA-directed RNA polymerase subunit beta', partial [Ramlibacter sp.]